MTPEEKFLVDLQGYLVIKNVLTPAEVAALNAIADEKSPRPPGGRVESQTIVRCVTRAVRNSGI